ncbi:hypothetical protein TMEN_7556 [Trichophyton mentagrophytes]|uniref:DUF7053 domain-containing protein n=2 Tax=Trichophyton TaxID=5550 RepID=A0A059JCP2_TRIIM|nr:hypothetical protein TESG_04894 [Trichophyton tonsurans CBS 112818]EZF31943.1 hypothetical protein H101_04460 [Trichophyton interdigitale H6]KAG5205939.1 hypothetical protein GY631_6689 [Trichophyton interdigitale]KDB25217.1 hypothetical protein H109_02943 [Trichophyton interdigitale MR816]GBF64840.1 hypothetical protein TMEN_7556 [Trichophyton mentagrophytes]
MNKRSVFTSVTPLPSYITREMVVRTLHEHSEMIKLNPLVIDFKRCSPPSHAPPDEFHCVWYELTDRVQYLPGGLLSGNVSYKACFHDLPGGLQTHVYAPTGLDIQEKWSVGGNMPGEPRETVELGIPGAPREGLYLREDVNMRCNVLATGFVKKTLRRAHAVLVDRLLLKADIDEQKRMGSETATSISATSPSLASPSLRQQERMAHCSSWANSVEHPLASPQHARGSVAISEIDSGQHPPASLAQGGQNQEQKVFELA